MGRCSMQLLVMGSIVGILRTRGFNYRFFGAPGQLCLVCLTLLSLFAASP